MVWSCAILVIMVTPEEIIRQAKKCLKQARNVAAAHTAMGMAEFERGHPEKAIGLYEKALAENAEYAPAYAGLAIAKGKIGATEESITFFRRAIERAPDCSLLYNWLGDALFDSGLEDAAMQAYLQATDLNARDANAHNDLADIFRKQGDFAKAFDYYEKTLLIDPADTNARLEAAQVLMHMGRKEEAKTRLRELIVDYPNSDDAKTAHVVFATLQAQEGNYESAREHLEIAVCEFPFHAPLHFQLGLTFLILDQREAALQQLQKALDLDPQNRRAARLVDQLRAHP